MTIAAESGHAARWLRWSSPLLWLSGCLTVLPLLLLLPIVLPVGPMYWDIAVYLEAAQRIFQGQLPNVDFSGPVGPLGYYLFAAGLRLFPEGHPILLAQWSILLVTAPAFAILLRDVLERSAAQAWALLLPFLLFSVLPFNSVDFSLYPGVDGFGTYNRQVSLIMYVVAAALLFVRDRTRLTLVLALLVPALFLTKVTGFVAMGAVLAFAFAAGRIPLIAALVVGCVFLAAVLALEVTTGMAQAYLADILFLLSGNSDSLLTRFLTSASLNFGVIAPAALMVGLLAASDLASGRDVSVRNETSFGARLLDRDWLWLAVILFASVLFETQNTGSQSFIMIWPAIVTILTRRGVAGRLRSALLLLAAFATVPTASAMVHRLARAAAAEPSNAQLDALHLRSLGRVSAKPMFIKLAHHARAYFVAHNSNPSLTGPIANTTSYRPFSDHDYQLLWLSTADEAVGAIRAYEAAHGIRFGSIFATDFVNPYSWLLDRDAPRLLAIGAVPRRTAKPLDAAMAASLARTDLILVPRCTATALSEDLYRLYAPALDGHRRIALTPCVDGLVRAGL